uniref:Uncharacterized protein n=1 Tax=Lepeophtheirus salmonis TaxID=72036 RepID=A0A0K2SXF3_LEPSM
MGWLSIWSETLQETCILFMSYIKLYSFNKASN